MKLRLCPECSYKLNYRKIKEQEAREKEEAKRRKKYKEKSRKTRKSDDVEINEEGGGDDGGSRKRKDRRRREESSGSESESEGQGDAGLHTAGNGQSEASRIWGAPLPEAEPEKSRAEELDDYFEGLFQ